MTDRQRVYTKVLKKLKPMLKLSHQGHVVTLAMMITGIVLSGKAQLSVMSAEVPVASKNQSLEMRMRRWVKQPAIDVEVTYLPFAQQILAALSSAPLLLAMDGSQVGRGCMVLMVGVVYRSRLLPLAWVVYKGKPSQTRRCTGRCYRMFTVHPVHPMFPGLIGLTAPDAKTANKMDKKFDSQVWMRPQMRARLRLRMQVRMQFQMCV